MRLVSFPLLIFLLMSLTLINASNFEVLYLEPLNDDATKPQESPFFGVAHKQIGNPDFEFILTPAHQVSKYRSSNYSYKNKLSNSIIHANITEHYDYKSISNQNDKRYINDVSLLVTHSQPSFKKYDIAECSESLKLLLVFLNTNKTDFLEIACPNVAKTDFYVNCTIKNPPQKIEDGVLFSDTQKIVGFINNIHYIEDGVSVQALCLEFFSGFVNQAEAQNPECKIHLPHDEDEVDTRIWRFSALSTIVIVALGVALLAYLCMKRRRRYTMLNQQELDVPLKPISNQQEV